MSKRLVAFLKERSVEHWVMFSLLKVVLHVVYLIEAGTLTQVIDFHQFSLN